MSAGIPKQSDDQALPVRSLRLLRLALLPRLRAGVMLVPNRRLFYTRDCCSWFASCFFSFFLCCAAFTLLLKPCGRVSCFLSLSFFSCCSRLLSRECLHPCLRCLRLLSYTTGHVSLQFLPFLHAFWPLESRPGVCMFVSIYRLLCTYPCRRPPVPPRWPAVRHAQATERAHLSLHRGLHQTRSHGVHRAHDSAGTICFVF